MAHDVFISYATESLEHCSETYLAFYHREHA